MTLRYEPGTAFTVARRRVVVLLPEGGDHELLLGLWDRMGEDASIAEMLQTLTGVFGSNLLDMPPFALVERAGRRANVAVRGALRVIAEVTQGERVEVDGRDVTTWSERGIENVARFVATVGDVSEGAPLVDGGCALPVREGIVLASAIGWVAGADEDDLVEGGVSRGAHHASQAGARMADVDVNASMAAIVPQDVVAQDADLVPVGSATADAAPVAREPEPARNETVPEIETAPALRSSRGVVADEALPAAVAESGPAPTGVVPSVPKVASTDAAAAPGAEETEPAEDEYGHLWGSTVVRTFEGVAARAQDGAGEETPQDVTLAPIDEDHDEYSIYSDVIEDLRAAVGPSGAEMEPEETRTPVLAGSSAFEGHGASSSAYRSAGHVSSGYAAAPAQGYATGGGSSSASSFGDAATAVMEPVGAPTSGPEILARACGQGHANSPSREVCAVCGSPLVGDASPMPRPALGRILVSTGQMVDLDRNVVVGRRPRSVRGETDMARLVTVPSPQQDISRSHLEITLEGWHVLLSDLNTTNGTTLLRPGQSPRRLHPGEPTLMADGDVIDMGDGVKLTFAGLQ